MDIRVASELQPDESSDAETAGVRVSFDIQSNMANTSRKRMSRPKSSKPSQTRNAFKQRKQPPGLVPISPNRQYKTLFPINQQNKIVVYSFIVCNVLVTGFQLYTTATSHSLLLFTTALNFIAIPRKSTNLIAQYTYTRIANHQHRPVVISRTETAARILAAFLTMTIFLVLVAFSCQNLYRARKSSPDIFSILVFGGLSVVKYAFYLFYRVLRKQQSPRILWRIHHRDILLHALAISISIGASKIQWSIDPIGAITLSIFILRTWTGILIQEFKLLIGVSTDPKIQDWIRDMALTHHEHILAVDSVRAYHAGPGLIVELELVMCPCETLRASHDIAEKIRMKLERNSLIERAFVRVTYESMSRADKAG